MLLGDVVKNNAYRLPNKEAIVDITENRRMTWDELNRRVNRLSNSFGKMRLHKGDKLAFLCPNSFRYVELCLAAAKMGIIVVPLNIRLAANEISGIINDSEACAAVVDKAFIELIRSMESSLSHIRLLIGINNSEFPHEYERLIQENTEEEPTTNIGEDDIYAIPYTSGTTGVPKGCCLTHKNVIMSALLHQPDYALTPFDKYLSVLPMFFSVSIATFFTPAIGGACVIIMPFEAGRAIEILEKENVNGAIMVPTMIHQLINHPDISKYKFENLKLFTLVGSPMPVGDLKKAINIFGNIFVNSYACTEICYCGIMLRPEFMVLDGPESKRLASIGKPFLGVNVKVVDENRKEVEWGSGLVGEIAVKSDTVMKGYWKRADETGEVLRDGWFFTGDLATVDKEGFIYLVDRKKDMIITGGINVYPKEIENVIQGFPEVDSVAVIGVPDEKWGEAIKAFVKLREGTSLGEEEVIERCKLQLASYKKPRSVEFVSEFPVSATGKTLKKVLREKYWRDYKR